jgi:hypothetical protein
MNAIIMLIQGVLPDIFAGVIIAFILWLIPQIRKMVALVKEIPDMKCDIKETRIMNMHQMKRLDAQDISIVGIYTAMQNGRVNGEAKEAITAMHLAKDQSDEFMSTLIFDPSYTRNTCKDKKSKKK